MNNKLKHILLFAVVWLLASCSSSKPVPTETNTKTITITETLHDTVFKIEKDSSDYKALLECRNGKVMVKEVLQSSPGRSLESPRVNIKNNRISVDCELKKQELYAYWKSKQVKEVEYKTIHDTKYVNRLTFWQELQIWLGRIFLVILAVYVIRQSYKFYNYMGAIIHF